MSTARDIIETGAADPFHKGDRIRKARERTGMNRQDFASAVGIHRATLGKYEDTGEGVKRPAMLSIALASGVRLEWLESGELPWVNENPHQSPDGGRIVGPAGFDPTTSTVKTWMHNAEIIPLFGMAA